MTSTRNGRRRISLRAGAAAALLLLTACNSAGPAEPGALGAESTATAGPTVAVQTPPPEPSAPKATPDAAAPAPALPSAMPESVPASLNLPSVGASSSLMRLDIDDKGSLEVPPGSPGSPAGWYIHSPTPGEPGPAVILGHVNAEGGGPGIFADLRELQPGDNVEVTREDGSTAVFSVEYGEQYPKDAFPTEKVYGNTEGPELRLITCDGYDAKTGTFEDNYVVYARLNQ